MEQIKLYFDTDPELNSLVYCDACSSVFHTFYVIFPIFKGLHMDEIDRLTNLFETDLIRLLYVE